MPFVIVSCREAVKPPTKPVVIWKGSLDYVPAVGQNVTLNGFTEPVLSVTTMLDKGVVSVEIAPDYSGEMRQYVLKNGSGVE